MSTRKIVLFLTTLLLLAAHTSCQMLGARRDAPFDKEKRSLDGHKKIVFDSPLNDAVRGYWIANTDNTDNDPKSWSLWGSNNMKKWIKIDERRNQAFWSRYTEREYAVPLSDKYKKYALLVETASGDSLTSSDTYDIRLLDQKPDAGWENFVYPKVVFHYRSPQTEGSRLYGELVPHPEAYIQYHARKVCEILFWTAENPATRNHIDKITYELSEYDGISAMSGGAPHVSISFSTRYIETLVSNSTREFSDETRGILFHEITHGYQNQPKGCGTYDGKSAYWAAIEGIADAVRIDAGFHKKRKPQPDGNWMDGYTTTGFFVQWFRTKDPDALRKFHDTMRTCDPWSFDIGIKAVFGEGTTVEALWNEYGEFIKKNPDYHHYTNL